MRKVLAAFLLIPLAAVASPTREVIVLTSAAVDVAPTPMPFRKGIEIYNHGPNAIWCAVGGAADAALNKAHKIPAEATWALEASDLLHVWCKAETADQVTTAATVVTEVL